MSLESQHGWHDLYLALGAWPERILFAANSEHRDRDELDFYLCFFVQCWSLRDWAKESGLISFEEMQPYIDSYDCMKLCRDIANRYKHLTIRASSQKHDKDWSIWEDADGLRRVFMVTARGKSQALWDLMIECIEFWEAITAALEFDGKRAIFRPQEAALSINLTTMANGNDHDDHSSAFYFCDDAVIAEPIAPMTSILADQRLSALARVVESRDVGHCARETIGLF